MTSLHRHLPTWLTPDPDGDESKLLPFQLGLHFSTARPAEVRLRVPYSLVNPSAWARTESLRLLGEQHGGHAHRRSPQRWAVWSVDRDLLRASVLSTPGCKYGIGNVQIGQTFRHWCADLKPTVVVGSMLPRVVIGTQVAWIREFVADVERLVPTAKVDELLDVDGCIARLLGSPS